MHPIYGISGLVLLVLDVYALYLIITSSAEVGMKLLWIILVLVLPLLGAILYLIVGRGPGNRSAV